MFLELLNHNKRTEKVNILSRSEPMEANANAELHLLTLGTDSAKEAQEIKHEGRHMEPVLSET